MPRPWLNAASRPASRPHAKGRAADTTLDRFNDFLDDGRTLHPTKGFRTISVKRLRAQQVMAEIFAGRRVPLHAAALFLQRGW